MIKADDSNTGLHIPNRVTEPLSVDRAPKQCAQFAEALSEGNGPLRGQPSPTRCCGQEIEHATAISGIVTPSHEAPVDQKLRRQRDRTVM